MLLCGNIVARGRYESSVSTVLIGREQSRDPFAVILFVISLWRLPSCFGAMSFCDDTVTRRRCYESRSNVSTVLMDREPSRDL